MKKLKPVSKREIADAAETAETDDVVLRIRSDDLGSQLCSGLFLARHTGFVTNWWQTLRPVEERLVLKVGALSVSELQHIRENM